jgi:hypothetical protein
VHNKVFIAKTKKKETTKEKYQIAIKTKIEYENQV